MTLKVGAWWWWWSPYWHGVCLSPSGPLYLRTIDWVVYKQEKFILWFWRLEVWDQGLSGLWMSCWILSWQGGEMALPLIWTLIPTWRFHLTTQSPPKGPTPLPTTLGVRGFSIWIWGRHPQRKAQTAQRSVRQTVSALIEDQTWRHSCHAKIVPASWCTLNPFSPSDWASIVQGQLNSTVRQQQRQIQIQKRGHFSGYLGPSISCRLS